MVRKVSSCPRLDWIDINSFLQDPDGFGSGTKFTIDLLSQPWFQYVQTRSRRHRAAAKRSSGHIEALG